MKHNRKCLYEMVAPIGREGERVGTYTSLVPVRERFAVHKTRRQKDALLAFAAGAREHNAGVIAVVRSLCSECIMEEAVVHRGDLLATSQHLCHERAGCRTLHLAIVRRSVQGTLRKRDKVLSR